jgi:hypothetical protein
MGGPVERPIEISTPAIVLDFSPSHAPFAVSLQDTMTIILKRSQDETFSAPAEWATFINQVKAQGTGHNLGSYGGLLSGHNLGSKKEDTA